MIRTSQINRENYLIGCGASAIMTAISHEH